MVERKHADVIEAQEDVDWSIMTEEEEEKYPSRIIGTISEIPDYEEWGTGKVKVNGRIWIRIR